MMHIDPFWAGVLTTILDGSVGFVLLAIIYAAKDEKKDK